ncbi:MAG: hypothetical protein HC836_49640 [Richelia sp. RM2_1_2]|nr:hypothetical protein [Richelia sp. RM2_1_2]
MKAYDLSGLKQRYTHLFEIIYPENRIVVNYDGAEKLVLLGLIDRESGYDFGHQYMESYIIGACFGYCEPFEVVKRHDDICGIQELKSRNIFE